MLLDVGTLRTLLRPTVQNGFDWSPDGAWFALSRGREIALSGGVRSDPAYILPIESATLAWSEVGVGPAG
jgi:hypothetical protein